jgi:hypothetical protein
VSYRGDEVHGNHATSDLTTAAEIPFYDDGTGKQRTLGSTERLKVCNLAAVVGDASTLTIFFDKPSFAARDVVSFGDNGANPDTMVLAGDLREEFGVGRSFDIANDSDNNGTYTVTAVEYDEDTAQTTVSVATGSWSGTTADGDATASRGPVDGLIIADGSFAANGGIAAENRPPVSGPSGYRLYAVAGSATDTRIVFTGVVSLV